MTDLSHKKVELWLHLESLDLPDLPNNPVLELHAYPENLKFPGEGEWRSATTIPPWQHNGNLPAEDIQLTNTTFFSKKRIARPYYFFFVGVATKEAWIRRILRDLPLAEEDEQRLSQKELPEGLTWAECFLVDPKTGCTIEHSWSWPLFTTFLTHGDPNHPDIDQLLNFVKEEQKKRIEKYKEQPFQKVIAELSAYYENMAGSKMKCNTFGPRRLEVNNGQPVSALEHG